MDIVVCVKQTPVPAETEFDEETKTLIREGVALTISTLDRRALLEALRLRDEAGGTVTVLTLGPPQARSALIDTLALGADKAVLLSDPIFAGSDTLATARALSTALRKLDPSLIMCGKFTIDSETGQVPSEIAEFLDWPQITSVRAIRSTDRSDVMAVERETDDGFETYEVTLPAVISVTEFVIAARRPTPEEIEIGSAKPLETWTASDIEIDPQTVGIAGSPTRVAQLQSARMERTGTVLSGQSPEAAAQSLAEYMLQNGLFGSMKKRAAAEARRATPSAIDSSKAIWIVVEMMDDKPRPVSYELLGKAQDLANRLGGEVAAVLVGASSVASHVPTLGAYGADIVYLAADDTLAAYDTAAYAGILTAAIRDHAPYAVFLSSTTNGRDWAARVAARLQVGLTGDCVDLELDDAGDLAQMKPAFGGNVIAPIYSNTIPIMATVRPGMLDAKTPRSDSNPRVVNLTIASADPRVKRLESHVDPDLDITKFDNADVIVAIGLGVGGPENIPLVRELVQAVDGGLAASLRVASAGWLPPQLQIGLTGKAVTPQFYIAIGVSGQANHIFGARKAQHIIAINNDPEAPIFKGADIGVVGDWAEVVPALTRALLTAKDARARD